jgi:hypothetical protein
VLYRPASLWILNPGLLIQRLELGGTERERLVRNKDRDSVPTYGTIERSQSEDGYCWVCHDTAPTTDLIRPCRCQLHRSCIQRWVAHRASNPEVSRKEALKCQVCREKYFTKNRRCRCLPQGLSRKHWVQVAALLVFLLLTALASFYVLVYAHLSSSVKMAIVVVLAFIDAALLKLLGCGLLWLGRRHRAIVGEITNRPSDLPFAHDNHHTPSSDVIPQATPTGTSSTNIVPQATPTETFPSDVTLQAAPPINVAPSDSRHTTRSPVISPHSASLEDSIQINMDIGRVVHV